MSRTSESQVLDRQVNRPRRRAAHGRSRWQLGIVSLLLVVAACAAKLPPPLPATLAHPEFLYPAVPPSLQASTAAPHIDRGWRFLQNGDESSAEDEFAAAVKRSAAFFPAHAGAGYVALARRNYERAVTAFDTALAAEPAYVPALVGRGQALLALNREAEALAAFEQALRLDGSLVDLARRVDVLRFRGVQDVIERARGAATAGRAPEARAAYERAIAMSPDSSFLYRELGMLERRLGDSGGALAHLQQAIALDPSDAAALVESGAILEERQDFDGAIALYRRALDIDATPELSARVTAATARAREARLPAEFKAIGGDAPVTRGDLAALIGIRLEPLLSATATRQVVATDLRNHWAAGWIDQVLRAGIMDPFANHTFQPRARVQRGELATAVSRVLTLIAARQPRLTATLAERPRIADMGAGHLGYPAAAAAVAAGVLPLDNGRFQVNRQVTGAEALDAIARLRALADLR